MSRPRLNVRLFAILFLIAIIGGVGVFFLHRYQSQNQAGTNLEQARRYCDLAIEETEPIRRFNIIREALDSYRLYLQANPEDVDIQVEEATFLVTQGEWTLENGEPADAYALFGLSSKILEHALRQAENRKDIRKKFVDILFNLGDYTTAKQHLRFLCDFPEDQQALQKLFDRYDLWERAVAAGKVKVNSDKDRDFSPLLKYDRKTVDQEQLVKFLGDDIWTIMEDPDLLSILGRCQFIANNPEPAIKALEKSVTLSPDNMDAYDVLIKALRLENRDKDAEYWLSEVVGANPDRFHAYLIRGNDHLNRSMAVRRENASEVLTSAEKDALKAVQKATQQILESADQIIPNDPATKTLNQDFNAVTNLAPGPGEAITDEYRNALLKAVTHVEPAVKSMEKTLSEKEKKNKTKSQEQDVVSPISMANKALEGCRDGLLLAVKCEIQKSALAPENSTKHLDTARNLAQAVLSMFPEDDKVYLTLADIELQSQNHTKMIDWMIQGTQKAKENSWLLWRLGTALAYTDRIKEARDILEQLRISGVKKMMATHLEATLEMKDQNWSAAAAKLEEVRPEFVTNPTELRKIDILLAECYGKLGRLKDQRESFARAASYDRTWEPALIGLAKTRAASGQLDEALKDYELILRFQNVAPERRLEYAQLLLQSTMQKPKNQRNFKLVEDAIDQAAIVAPNNLLIPILRTDILIAKGEVEKARNSLTNLHQQINAIKEQLLQQRKTLLSEAKSLSGAERDAKLQEAKTLMASAQSYDKQKTYILTKLISIASQQGDWQIADQAIEQAESKLGDTPSLRWLRAQKLFQKSGKEAAADLHPLAENTDDFERTDRLNLFRRLATMALFLEDTTQAEKLANRVLEAEPGDVEMQKVLFQIAKNQEDYDAMESILDRIRKTEDKASAFWHYGEAVRLHMLAQKVNDPKSTQDAVNLLLKASRMEPLWPAPTLLLAQIFEEQGKLTEATNLYLDAVRNGMQNPTVIRNVAALLMQQRRYQEADEMFNRLAQLRGEDSLQDLNVSASYVKAQLGDFGQSIDMARKACVDSNDYRDFVWLGRVLGVAAKRASEENRNEESQKLYNEAEQAFRKALEINQSATDAWIALVQFYGLFDKKEEASKTLEQAKAAIPEKEADLALAQVYESLGEVQKAATYYRKAIRSAPRDAEIARIATVFFLKNNFSNESEMLLKRIADKHVDADDEQVAWAKRALGLLMLRKQGSGNIAETLSLIDENLKANPNSVVDLYTKASLLANDPTGLHQEEAIALLEQIKSQHRDPGILVLQELADLYYATDRWGEFKDTMRNILSNAGDQSRVVGKYIIRLSEHGEYGEANTWIARLKNIAPDDPNTFLTECDLAFAQKQYDVLLKMLNDWTEKDTKELSQINRLQNASSICQRYAFRLNDQNQNAIAGRFERQAEDFMQKCIKLEPKLKPNLAILYSQQGQFDKALVALNQIADKISPVQFGQMVYMILSEGDPSESHITQIQTILKQISDAHPDEIFTKMMLALCAEELEQSDKAEAILRECLNKHPNNVDLMNYLAITLALRGKNLDESQQLIDKAIAIAGPKPDLLDSRAMVSLAQDNPKAAIVDLQRAITEKPTSGSFYFHLAEALQAEGLKKMAKDVLKKADQFGFRETSLSPAERRNYRRLKLALQ